LVRVTSAQARGNLNPDGWLVLGIGNNREALEAAFPELPFTWPETAAGSGHVFVVNEAGLP